MTVDCLHWFVDGPILSVISHPGIAWSNSNKKRVPVDEGVRVPGHEDHEEDDEDDHGDHEDHEEDVGGGGRRYNLLHKAFTDSRGLRPVQHLVLLQVLKLGSKSTQTGEQINSLHGKIKFAMEGETKIKMTRRLIVPLPPEALCYSALP